MDVVVPVGERKAWRQSHLTFADLVELERSNERTTEQPTELPFADIWTAEDAFQPRTDNGTPYLDKRFAHILAEAIRKQNGPLKPIKVIPVGQQFFVVDGHHRLMAYAMTRWDKLIPVEVFKGTVVDAMAACSEENHQEKLPMSQADKSERAWVLVKIGVHNQKQVTKATGASESQFYIMKRKLRELGDSAQEMTWMQILRKSQPTEATEYEDWVDIKAKEMADLLSSKIDKRTLRNVDVFARMIEIGSPTMVDSLIDHWALPRRRYAEDREEAIHIQSAAAGVDF